MSEQVNAAAPVAAPESTPAPEAVDSQSQEQSNENSPESAAPAAELSSGEQKELNKLENKDKLNKQEQKRLNKLLLKVDGKEIEEILPFDLPDDPKAREYMIKQLQMAKVGSKRGQEYTTLQKEAAQFIKKLQEDPFAVLNDPNLSINVKEQVAKYIEKEIEQTKKSPEQIEKEKLEAELSKIRTEREQEKEQLKQRELELLQQKATEDYDRQITDALKDSGLPRSQYVVGRIVDWMSQGLEKGLDVTAQDVLPIVQEEIRNELREMFSLMPEEMFEKILGEEVFTKIRKKNIQQAKQVISTKLPDVAVKAPEPEKPSDKKSYRDFFGKL